MRRLAGCWILVGVLCTAGPANAEGFNNFLAGVNGILTAPAEPVMHVIEPPETLQELPGAPYVSHPLGLVSGTLKMVYQLGMGVVDVVFTPLWVMRTVSPEARWQMFPDLEYGY